MVHPAGRLCANLPQFAFVDAVRHNGLGGVLAGFELRPLRFLGRVGLLFPDFDVFVPRDGPFTYRLLLVCPLHHIPESSDDDLNAGPLGIRLIFSNPGPESNWYRLRID